MPWRLADRYHLIQNLRDHLQHLLDHKRSCLPFVEDTALKGKEANPKEKADSPIDLALGANAAPTPGPLPLEQLEIQTCTETDLSCLTYAECKKKMSRDRRVSRYEEVMALHREGLGHRAIARQLRTSREHRAALCLLARLSRTSRRLWTACIREEQARSISTVSA